MKPILTIFIFIFSLLRVGRCRHTTKSTKSTNCSISKRLSTLSTLSIVGSWDSSDVIHVYVSTASRMGFSEKAQKSIPRYLSRSESGCGRKRAPTLYPVSQGEGSQIVPGAGEGGLKVETQTAGHRTVSRLFMGTFSGRGEGVSGRSCIGLSTALESFSNPSIVLKLLWTTESPWGCRSRVAVMTWVVGWLPESGFRRYLSLQLACREFEVAHD